MLRTGARLLFYLILALLHFVWALGHHGWLVTPSKNWAYVARSERGRCSSMLAPPVPSSSALWEGRKTASGQGGGGLSAPSIGL